MSFFSPKATEAYMLSFDLGKINKGILPSAPCNALPLN